MKICSKCKIVKPHVEYYVRKDSKDGYRNECKICVNSINNTYKIINKVEISNKSRSTYATDSKYSAHKKAIAKAYSNSHKENRHVGNLTTQQKLAKKLTNAKYRACNSAKRNADKAKRRASICSQTPKWADLVLIQKFYTLAKILSAETGISYQVDHIIPLQSKTISGLHVETNLQVITAKDNQIKNNKIIDEIYGVCPVKHL